MSESKSDCAICLEKKNIWACCPHCKEGNYCKKCIGKLVDESKYETCPICRRENWYKDEENIQKIIKKKLQQHKRKNVSDILEENESNDYTILSFENVLKGLLTILFICALTLLGYYTMFELFELENNFSENTIENNIITITISFLTGILINLIIFIMILINKLILGDDWYECCCNPMIILPIILLLLLGTFLGSNIINGADVTLNVNEKQKDIVMFIISFLVGNSLIICPTIILVICIKCKTRELQDSSIYEDNSLDAHDIL